MARVPICDLIDFSKIITITIITLLLSSTKAYPLHPAENFIQNDKLAQPFAHNNNLSFVNVSCGKINNCLQDIYVDDFRVFICIASGNINDTYFQWKFVSNGAHKHVITNNDINRNETTSVDNRLVKQEIKVKFRNLNTIGIECSVKNSNGSLSNKMDITMAEDELPIVLNNDTVTLTDVPGLQLNCSFKAKTTKTLQVYWMQDDEQVMPENNYYMTDFTHRTSKYTGPTKVYNQTSTNITCVVENDIGTSAKTFIVQTPQEHKYSISEILLILISVVPPPLVIAFIVYKRGKIKREKEEKRREEEVKRREDEVKRREEEEKRRKEEEKRREEEVKRREDEVKRREEEEKRREKEASEVKVKAEEQEDLKRFKENEPRDIPKIIFDSDKSKYKKLKGGAHGEVYRYKVTDQERVVIKTFKWPPHLSVKNAKLMFEDLENEIKLGQLFSKPENKCDNIVRYLGFDAPSIQYFRVNLILEYCTPGQMLNFLYNYSRYSEFYTDIGNGTYLYENRIREQRIRETQLLATSHLMRWAEKIALAMKLLHKNNVIHRDLAARNILLQRQGPNFDNWVVKLADFGMSRVLSESDIYVLVLEERKDDKPRKIPARWYPPESLAKNSEYTKKSDVWSFGVLLWEMFSIGQQPFADVKPSDLRKTLLAGQRLDKPQGTPVEIWALMQRCWENTPADRPSFEEIHEILLDINNKYKLHEPRTEILEDDEGREIDEVIESDENSESDECSENYESDEPENGNRMGNDQDDDEPESVPVAQHDASAIQSMQDSNSGFEINQVLVRASNRQVQYSSHSLLTPLPKKELEQ